MSHEVTQRSNDYISIRRARDVNTGAILVIGRRRIGDMRFAVCLRIWEEMWRDVKSEAGIEGIKRLYAVVRGKVVEIVGETTESLPPEPKYRCDLADAIPYTEVLPFIEAELHYIFTGEKSE